MKLLIIILFNRFKKTRGLKIIYCNFCYLKNDIHWKIDKIKAKSKITIK